MELFRTETVELWRKYFDIDEYDADVQRTSSKETFTQGESTKTYEFVLRNMKAEKILDIGCAGGLSFQVLPILAGLEPNPKRYEEAVKKGGDKRVVNAVAECIPFDPKSFTSVLSIGVLEHCRSDFEVYIEVNRVLEMGGVFIIVYPEARAKFVGSPTGRTYNGDHLVERLKDYGFSLMEKRNYETWGCIAVEKIKDFEIQDLLKLQYVKVGDLYKVNNLITPKW